MKNDWLNPDSDDNFNPEDHGIEMDEIAKMYAKQDMEENQRLWAREQADKFYKDFENLNIKQSIKAVHVLIDNGTIDLPSANSLFDNMISVYEQYEEYERCHICLQIKTGINA